MAIEFFGNDEDNLGNDVPDELGASETDGVFDTSYAKIESLFKDATPDKNAFPPSLPFNLKALNMLLGNKELLELLDAFDKQCGFKEDDNLLDPKWVNDINDSALDERNKHVARLLMKAMTTTMRMYMATLCPETQKETDMFHIIMAYESMLYNMRVALAVASNFMLNIAIDSKDVNVDLLRESVNISSDVTEGKPLDNNLVGSAIQAVDSASNVLSVYNTLAQLMVENLEEQYNVHMKVLQKYFDNMSKS